MRMSASIEAAEVGRRSWDALVIGAGPAGSLAARQLAGLHLQTLLVERRAFPRAKVCGACLNGRAVATLREAGLEQIVTSSRAVPLRRFHLRCPGGAVSLPLHLAGGACGVAISREALDAALVRAALDSGAHFLPETIATVLPGAPEADCRTVRLSGAGGEAVEVAARVVMAADGLGHSCLPAHEFASRVGRRPRVGLNAVLADWARNYPPGVIHMGVGRAGYVGLARLEDGRLNVAAAMDPAFVKRSGGSAASVAKVLQETGFSLPAGLADAAWHGTLALTRRAHRPAGHRVLLLGDAAGYIEPFTGEGIAWALAAAMAAPPLAARGLLNWSGTLEQEWMHLHRQLVGRRQSWCRAFAWLLRHPGLVQAAVKLLDWFPSLARPVVRGLNAPDVLRAAG